MAKNLGVRTVMIMNQAKQEVVRREESEEVQKNDLENDVMLQTKSESGTLKSVGKMPVLQVNLRAKFLHS